MRLLGAVLGLFAMLLAGCSRQPEAPAFTGEFRHVAIDGAPDQIRQAYDRMKGTPGLYVITADTQTYLLVCAGRTQDTGRGVEVLELKRVSPDSKEVRVLATVKRQAAGAAASCAAVEVEHAGNLTFKARLNAGEEGVLELRGVPVDR